MLSRASAIKPGGSWATRAAERQSLEQAAHAVRFGKAARGLDQAGCAHRRLGACQPIGPLEQAEPGKQHALRDRAMDYRAGINGSIG